MRRRVGVSPAAVAASRPAVADRPRGPGVAAVATLAAGLLTTGCGEGADGPADGAGAAVEFAVSSSPDEVALDSLLADADEVYWSGDLVAAGERFRATLELARRLGDAPAEALSLTSLGLAAWRQGDYGEARRLGEEALALKLERGLHDQLWRSYNALGLLAYEESRYFDAVDLHGRALELAEAAGDTTNLAKTWSNLGLAHTELGQFAEARRLQDKATAAARAAGAPLLEGRTLNQLGVLEVRVGEPAVAAAHLHRALALAREAEDPVNEENTLAQLGTAYAAMGEPGRAIAYLDSALALAREVGLREDEAADLEHLADLYRQAGEFRRALRLFQEAKAVNEELGREDEKAANLRSEAEIYAALGNLETARRLVEAAGEIHRRIGNRLEALSDELLLAELAQAAGDQEAAAGHLRDATRLGDELDARSARAAVALTVARVADREEDAAGVLGALDGAADGLEGVGLDAEWEAHALRARAHERRGARDSAVAAGRRAVEAVERVRGRFGSGLLRTSYSAERETPYLDLVRILLRQGREEEAFEVADGVRGRALVEHLATARADGAPTVRELAEEERQLLSEVHALVARIHELGDGSDEEPESAAEAAADLDRLRERLESARAAYATALVRAEERKPEVLSLLAGRRPEGSRVREALRPGEVLLEYLVTPGSVRLFVVGPEGVRSFETPVERSELATRVRIAREMASDPDADPGAAGPTLAGLHRILIEPAEASGALEGAGTLLIVPHAELVYVPFAALKGPTGRYLARDVALLHLPSAAALPALRDGWPASGRAQTGATVFAPFPRELRATAAEARAFRDALPSAVAWEGRRATEARFRTALAEARVVHAATHGVLNALSPMFSRIELARGASDGLGDDGRFEVHELVGAPVRASLVFLSGCETGAGSRWSTTFGRGEDYTTLARAFLYAGAANVVATLWRVEDEGAAAFAEAFYRRLAASGPIEALAAAQRQMMDDPTYAAPYYWAAYRVAGSGEMKDPAQEAGRLTVLERGS